MISVNVVFAAASVRLASLPSPSILCPPACHNYLHFTSSSNLALSSFFSPFWALAAQAQGSRVSASSPASSHVIISNQGQQRPVDVVIIVAASGFSSVSGSGSVAAALFVFVVSSCKLPLKVLKCCTWFVIKTLQRGGSRSGERNNLLYTYNIHIKLCTLRVLCLRLTRHSNYTTMTMTTATMAMSAVCAPVQGSPAGSTPPFLSASSATPARVTVLLKKENLNSLCFLLAQEAAAFYFVFNN